MAETIFLKTTAFGGYDKEDVNKYLNSLYSQIFELKNKLSEAEFAVREYKTGTEQEKIYESMLSDKRTEITRLQAENQIMSETLESLKADNELKYDEISVLKENISELEQDISETNMKLSSLQNQDEAAAFSMVFVEAKKSADTLMEKAKKKASELEINSRQLAENIISEANNKALEITSEADSRSKQLEIASGNMKALMLDDVNKINQVFMKLKDTFEEFQKSGGDILEKSEKMLSETKNTLEEDGVPVFRMPETYENEIPDAPANEYDDPEFISDLDSINIISDNFMNDFQDDLEHELMEFETGRVNTSENENISLEELARQADSINDKNNSKKSDKKSNGISLEELARQADAIS